MTPSRQERKDVRVSDSSQYRHQGESRGQCIGIKPVSADCARRRAAREEHAKSLRTIRPFVLDIVNERHRRATLGCTYRTHNIPGPQGVLDRFPKFLLDMHVALGPLLAGCRPIEGHVIQPQYAIDIACPSGSEVITSDALRILSRSSSGFVRRSFPFSQSKSNAVKYGHSRRNIRL